MDDGTLPHLSTSRQNAAEGAVLAIGADMEVRELTRKEKHAAANRLVVCRQKELPKPKQWQSCQRKVEHPHARRMRSTAILNKPLPETHPRPL